MLAVLIHCINCFPHLFNSHYSTEDKPDLLAFGGNSVSDGVAGWTDDSWSYPYNVARKLLQINCDFNNFKKRATLL